MSISPAAASGAHREDGGQCDEAPISRPISRQTPMIDEEILMSATAPVVSVKKKKKKKRKKSLGFGVFEVCFFLSRCIWFFPQ